MSRLALVSGGAGFIGSHLVEALLARDFEVRVLDDFSTGHEENLADVPASAPLEVVRGDCSDSADVDAAMKGVSVVFHEAAMPSVPKSVEDPVTSNRINVQATLHMLEAARRNDVERFVFAGSCAAYGDGEELPKRETLTPEPLSPYAADKLASESYCRVFAHCYGLPTVVLRYFNVFGPRQDPSSPYSGVISLFITRLLAGEAGRIFGDGEQSRDFVYVGDVVEANVRAATRAVEPGSVINVATARRTTLNDLYRAIQRAVGPSADRLDPIYASSRSGDIRDSLADVTRAREWLGYDPQVSLDEGLQRTVDYYRKEIMT